MKAPCPTCGTLVKERNYWPTGGGRKQPRPFLLQSLLDQLQTKPSTWASRWGVSGTDLKRYMAEGLTEYQADRYAVRAGLHPGDVWPEWWAA